MLATKDFVKGYVYSIADMRGGIDKRYYVNKCAGDAEKRNLGFKFYEAADAERVAEALKATLKQHGFNNAVKVTDTVTKTTGEFGFGRWGGHYVRVLHVLM